MAVTKSKEIVFFDFIFESLNIIKKTDDKLLPSVLVVFNF